MKRCLCLCGLAALLAGCGDDRRGGVDDYQSPGPIEESPPSLQPGEVYDRGGTPPPGATNGTAPGKAPDG